MRVLLIEDALHLGALVEEELAERGHDVTWARSLGDARRCWAGRTAPFDAILCDYELPLTAGSSHRGTGLDFLRDVHAEPGSRPRTVLWSGLDRTRELLVHGVEPDAFVLKDSRGVERALAALEPVEHVAA